MIARWPTVLFDLDGTIVHSVPLIVASYRETLAHYGLPDRSDAEIAAWIGLTLEDVFASLGFADVAEPTTFYRTWNEAHHDTAIAPCPGMPALVAELKDAGVDVRVVTSKGRALAERGLLVVGVEGLEVLVAKEDTLHHKPHPEPLLRAVDLLGTEPSRCVYVGDAVYDVRCAQAAGLDAIAVTWGAGGHDHLAQAEPLAVVDTAAELRSLLLHR